MRCFPFLCGSRASTVDEDCRPAKPLSPAQQIKASPASALPAAQLQSQVTRSPDLVLETASPTSASFPSPPPAVSQQPSSTQPHSQTAQASVGWSKGASRSEPRQHVEADEGVELIERDEAIKQAFSTPSTGRELFPATVEPTQSASPPSANESTSSASSSSTSASPSTGPSCAVSPPLPSCALPPPHPGTHSRRQSMSVPFVPPPPPVRSSTQSHIRSVSSSTSNISPSFRPTASPPLQARSNSQPPSPFSSVSPSSYSRTPKANSTPLRARRLQRHRALSQSSPHSALFPRSSHIGSSAHLASFFSSSAALSLMRDRLTRGLIAVQHQSGEEPRYKLIFCSASLSRLHYVDLPLSGTAIPPTSSESFKQPHILASSLCRVTKGLSTKSFIQKQSELGERAQLDAGLLLSLCSPTVALDLECVSESERDEWWLTFDFLLEYWNQWRRQQTDATNSPLSLSSQSPAKLPTIPPRGRRGSWLGAVVGLYEQHDRMARQSHKKVEQLSPAILTSPVSSRRQSASIVSTASPCSARSTMSEYELYSMMGRYVNDIEAVREANRVLLVDDCALMIDMQAKMDVIRMDNARLIDELAPTADY